MNKQIAIILRDALSGLPMIEKAAGLVQAVEYTDTTYDEAGTPRTIIKRIPIAEEVEYDPMCEDNTLVPDSSKRGILYFEDGGISPFESIRRGFSGYRSRLRLVVWLNTQKLTSPAAMVIPALTMHIQKKVEDIARYQDIFIDFHARVVNIPPATPAIFAPYTYNIHATQYLMKPFEFFAMDIEAEYLMGLHCLPPELNFDDTNACL